MVFRLRPTFPAILLFTSLSVLGLSLVAIAPSRVSGEKSPDDAALERTRAQVKMLDDLFKVAVVDITNRYDGPPAAKVAKAIFAAAREKEYFNAKLLDATGSPQNEANVPGDDFEKKAAQVMVKGKTYFEQIVESGSGHRRLRAATVVPASRQAVRTLPRGQAGDLLGFLSYDVPIR